MRKVYELKKGRKTLLTVAYATPDWFPLKPKLSRPWLRAVVAQVLEKALPADEAQPFRRRVKGVKKSALVRVLR